MTALWDRAHEIAAGIAAKPTRRDARHGARDLGVARPSVPRPRWSRACCTRALGNPIGMAEAADHDLARAAAEDPLMRTRFVGAGRADRKPWSPSTLPRRPSSSTASGGRGASSAPPSNRSPG